MATTIKVTARQRETLAAVLADTEATFNEETNEVTFVVADPADFLAARLGDKNKALLTAVTKKLAAAPAKPAPAAKAAKAADKAEAKKAADKPKPAPRKVNKPYVNKERTRRNTGTRTRILYLLAEDRPADAIAPAKAEDGSELVFAVECVTHGVHKHMATYAAAYAAAKVSPEWCGKCGPAAKEHQAAKAAKAEAAKKPVTTVTVNGPKVTVTERKRKPAARPAKGKAAAEASA